MNTEAIAEAIHRCSAAGGGIVAIPPGMWLTGPIKLESNIELHLDSGAVVLFSKRFEDFPMFARPKSGVKCIPMIYGSGLENIAVTGKGIFDGNGQYWRPVKKEKMTERQWKELVASGGAVTPDGKMWWPSKEAMDGQEYIKNLRKQNKKPAPERYAGAREFLRPV
ncbi:MAG TPA: glycoside hydrolase family 28 protein, partial [Bacteroidota bacterium]|nr:glycoside hydrolase family 28 protein [Bacteroidota bacterium]